ncbi:MAG: polysaccharide deacetylase family protein [Geobacteraceae bacterium]|nr:polysaccharide deacetylase family protein [Geobacteraceae bacterium]
MKPAIVTLSFDDGAPEDLEIATLLKKHELAATFYVPVTNVEGRPTLSPVQIVLLSEMGFEIGAHGYHHQYLDRIPATDVYEEIKSGKDQLEQILGQAVTSFCYPGGKTPVVAVNAVRQLGFRYARTVRECRFSVDDPLLAPTTNPIGWHCRRHYVKEALLSGNARYCTYFLKHRLWAMDWLDYSLANLEYAVMTGGICHFWGHAFEIDRNNEWERLERLLLQIETMQNQGQVVTRVNSGSFHGV